MKTLRPKRLSDAVAWVLFLLLSSLPARPATLTAGQEPVTGGEDLIPELRRLKTMGSRVHLEWIYQEDRCDLRPDQKELVRSGRPLEFTPGYLYHGRDGLDSALLAGRVEGPSYLTRAPHVWAVGGFRAGSDSPAIFVIQAEDFNRWRGEGRAELEAEVDRKAGIMDPYPKILDGFPLDSVVEIWIDEDTRDRYDLLLRTADAGLSADDRLLKAAVGPWLEKNRIVTIQGLRHSRLGEDTFYAAAFEAVGLHFIQAGLLDRMPCFRLRKGPISSWRP